MRFRLAVACALAAAAMFPAVSSHAQMNNQPVSFGAGGGYGMSLAARQAILDQHLSGVTPDDVLIGPGGGALNVTRDSNGLAVVTTQSGVILPQYRGRQHALGGLYFESMGGAYGLGGSHDTIDTWTSEVTGLGGRNN